VKKRNLLIVLGLQALWAPSWAHDVITTNLTFSRDVSRIFAAHCLSCHGSQSTIPLTTYAEARPWAVSIKDQVLSRAMPPWGAVKGFGDLSPDESLTQEDIITIAAWVVGGAPEGNPASLPQPKSVGSSARLPLFSRALVVQTRATLARELEAAAIQPLEDGMVPSAKITAIQAGGEVVPLLWLYQFDGASKRTFAFRSPLKLPAGTVIESSAPLKFAVETRGNHPSK
jgi:hypothetical protein